MVNFRRLSRVLSCFHPNLVEAPSELIETRSAPPGCSLTGTTNSTSVPPNSRTTEESGQASATFTNALQCHTQPNHTFPDLPVELLNAILLFSGSNDLCQVAKSSRLCNAVASRLLYRDIELIHPVAIVRCVNTLSESGVALHVRRFHISDDPYSSEVLPSFYKLVHKALLRMNNMVSLSLLIGGPHSFVLTGCTFRLKSFTTACHWDKHLVKWLESQDEITYALFCGKFHHDARISDGALPKLKRISASPLILAAVVPNRPVEEAELCLVHPWLLDSDVVATTLRILAFSSSAVHTLQFITHLNDSNEATLRALRAVPEHLPKLSSLAIHIVRGSVSKDILEGLTSVFSSFRSLRSVMILSKDEEDALHDDEMTKPLAEAWHQSCSSLEIVSFPDSIWVRNPRLGWVTLKELERILSEREQDLERKEKDLAERELDLAKRGKDIGGMKHLEGVVV